MIILTLAGFPLFSSCESDKTAANKSRITVSTTTDLMTISDEKLSGDLAKLNFIQRGLTSPSDTHFAGRQKNLDDFLKDIQSVLVEDEFNVTWIPDKIYSNHNISGTVRTEATSSYLKKMNNHILDLEEELHRRQTKKANKSQYPTPTASEPEVHTQF